MSDQFVGWLQVLIGLVGILLSIFQRGIRRRRRRRSLYYSRWKVGKLERTCLEMTDESQT